MIKKRHREHKNLPTKAKQINYDRMDDDASW